jgi:hypothetical protein
MARYRVPRREKIDVAVSVGHVLQKVLRTMGRRAGHTQMRGRLFLLWQNWDTVMGADLAALAHPLGGRNGILLIGAEDTMLAQELQFQSGELLERANAFLEQDYFTAVKISLCMGRQALNTRESSCMPAQRGWRSMRAPRQEPAHAHGKYLEKMNPASVVARAYSRFVDLPSADGRGDCGQSRGK